MPTASLLARCSEIVYAHPGETTLAWENRLAAQLREMEIEPVEIYDRHDVQFFVGLHYEHRITCFRGTDSAAEALTNFFAIRGAMSVARGCRVHRRFLIDAQSAVARLDSVVDFLDGDYTDWFTGHSRGGAIAAIVAAFVADQQNNTFHNLPRPHLVTHESPRVGNRVFAKYMRDHVPHVRWQTAGDVVPLLPFPPLYWHDVAPELFDSRDRLRMGAGRWTRLLQWIPATLAYLFVFSDVEPRHCMNRLYRLIKALETSAGVPGNLLKESLDR